MNPRILVFAVSLVTAGLCLFAAPLSAQTLRYRTFMPHTDTTLWRFAVDVDSAASGDGFDLRVVWRSESGDRHRHEYHLDARGGAGWWRVDFPERQTAYEGELRGDTLRVVGTIEGEIVDRRWQVADPLVLPNVGVGLSLFVRSGRQRIDFTAVRDDGSSIAQLDARREAIEWIQVDGRPVEVVRVRWAARGWRGWFYERYAWFRLTDGTLVRTDERDGRATELLRPPPVP